MKKISVSQRVPVNTINSDTRTMRLEGSETPFSLHSYVIDEEFLASYDIPLIAGRMLDKNFPEGETPFLLNETAVKQLGWKSNEEALGKRMQWSGTFKSGRIVGVVRDFHLNSLPEEIAPLVLTTIPEDQWWRTFISVRIEPVDLSGTLKFLETTWRKFTPDGAFEYFFKDFLKLVFIANLFAWPIAYYAMNQWLQDFAYRVYVGWPREITGLHFFKIIAQDPINGLHFFLVKFLSHGAGGFSPSPADLH